MFWAPVKLGAFVLPCHWLCLLLVLSLQPRFCLIFFFFHIHHSLVNVRQKGDERRGNFNLVLNSLAFLGRHLLGRKGIGCPSFYIFEKINERPKQSWSAGAGLFFFFFCFSSDLVYSVPRKSFKASHSVCFKRQDTNNSNLKYMHAFMISCRRIRRSRPCSPTPHPLPPLHGFLPCCRISLLSNWLFFRWEKKNVVCLYFQPS